MAITGLAGCSEAAAAQRRSGFGEVSAPLSQESPGSTVSRALLTGGRGGAALAVNTGRSPTRGYPAAARKSSSNVFAASSQIEVNRSGSTCSRQSSTAWSGTGQPDPLASSSQKRTLGTGAQRRQGGALKMLLSLPCRK